MPGRKTHDCKQMLLWSVLEQDSDSLWAPEYFSVAEFDIWPVPQEKLDRSMVFVLVSFQILKKLSFLNEYQECTSISNILSIKKNIKKMVCLYSGPCSGVRRGRDEGEGSHEDPAACAAPPIQHPRQDQSGAALHLQPWRYTNLLL